MPTPSNVIKFTEIMVSASELITRWPGLKVKRLIQLIDERIEIDGNRRTKTIFPEPFYLIGTKYITKKGTKADKLVYRCQNCNPGEGDRPKDWKPYKTKVKDGKKKHYLKRVVFRESDIENYELANRHILYTQEEVNNIISHQENKKNAKQRLPILQKDAAALCNVSPSTIRNWDNGIHQPLGYPGRHEGSTFILWAKSHLGLKAFMREAKAAGRAIPMDPATIEKLARGGVFQDDDGEYDED